MNQIIFANSTHFLKTLPDGLANLIYIDPPFNTGKTQQIHGVKYPDSWNKYEDFLYPKLQEAKRLLADDGSFFLHIDWRESHYCKIWLDQIFGRECFMNEIIWAYDYGGRAKRRWSAKHDSIFWYVKDPNNYCFNFDAMDRIPYMAPGLVGKEKAAKGKTPTNVWWHTIVPTNGSERLGYPTQKPLGVLRRIIQVHSKIDDLVLDFFAGSGTTGEAATMCSRDFLLIYNNPEAIKIMHKRLEPYLEKDK